MDNVCERSAVLLGGGGKLIQRKTAGNGVTVALCCGKIGALNLSKIYVVGIGPGEYEQMTMRAANALQSCDAIVGYTVYVDLVKEHFPEKNSSPLLCERK